MKILAVISALNFPRFTRRATIEAISKKVDQLDLLMYTGIKNRFKEKATVDGITAITYHFWVPDRLKGKYFLKNTEHSLRRTAWRKRFSEYDVIFFTDPNQAYLLSYTGSQKIVYLIRDPNVLQSSKNVQPERKLIERADIILATSQNLAKEYISKYHQTTLPNVKYWPNCVDLNIWNCKNFEKTTQGRKPIIGMAGNINDRTDLALLDYITKKTNYFFQLCGRIFLQGNEKQKLNLILKSDNVEHLGYIPFNELQQVVAQWNVGITIEGFNEYTLYTHHNKIYQYLALGIPVVTLKIHDDYSQLAPYVQSVENYPEYITALETAIEKSSNVQFRDECIAMANENSADKRSEDFLEWVKALE